MCTGSKCVCVVKKILSFASCGLFGQNRNFTVRGEEFKNVSVEGDMFGNKGRGWKRCEEGRGVCDLMFYLKILVICTL